MSQVPFVGTRQGKQAIRKRISSIGKQRSENLLTFFLNPVHPADRFAPHMPCGATSSCLPRPFRKEVCGAVSAALRLLPVHSDSV